MMNRKRAFALTIGLTLLLGFAASSTSQSIQGKEDANVPAASETRGESEVLEALGAPSTSKDTNLEPIALDITESSICTCEQAGKQGEQVKRTKDQSLDDLVIEKKRGESFSIITITINGNKKLKPSEETLHTSTVEPETIALDGSIEEDVKEEDVVKVIPDEKSPSWTKVEEEEPEVDKEITVTKKTKDEKVKGDKKLSKSSEKKRTKRTIHKGGKKYGKKGKGKSKGKRR